MRNWSVPWCFLTTRYWFKTANFIPGSKFVFVLVLREISISDSAGVWQNLEVKKINDEKKAAITAQNAAEATLRRVQAAQKDNDLPSLEVILAPLEAELKVARHEVSWKYFFGVSFRLGKLMVNSHLMFRCNGWKSIERGATAGQLVLAIFSSYPS